MNSVSRFAFLPLWAVLTLSLLLPACTAQENADGLGDLGAAPAVTMRTLDGSELALADLKGKVVVVDFWATWCAPCVDEIPGYVALQKEHGEKLVIIGVSVDRRGAEHVRQFAAKHGMNYPIVMGDEQLAEAFGGFQAIPTTFLIDREGRIRHRKVGAWSHEDYARLVARVL